MLLRTVRKIRFIPAILLLVMAQVLFIGTPGPVFGQTQAVPAARAEQERLAREIAARVGELVELQQARAEERARMTSRIERLDRVIAELDESDAELDKQEEVAKKRLAEVQTQVIRADQEIQRAEAAIAAVADEARATSGSSLNWLGVMKGPFEAPVAEALANVRAELDEGGDEGVSQLLTWYSEQLQRGRQRTIENRRVALDGERVIHAWVLRVGSVHTSFVSEDGRIVGFADPAVREGWRFGWRSDFREEDAAAIRRASDISRGEKPAGVVILPIVTTTPTTGQAPGSPGGGQSDE